MAKTGFQPFLAAGFDSASARRQLRLSAILIGAIMLAALTLGSSVSPTAIRSAKVSATGDHVLFGRLTALDDK